MKILLIAGLAESLINFRGSLITALQTKGLQVHVAAPNLPAQDRTRIELEATRQLLLDKLHASCRSLVSSTVHKGCADLTKRRHGWPSGQLVRLFDSVIQ